MQRSSRYLSLSRRTQCGLHNWPVGTAWLVYFGAALSRKNAASVHCASAASGLSSFYFILIYFIIIFCSASLHIVMLQYVVLPQYVVASCCAAAVCGLECVLPVCGCKSHVAVFSAS